ncbi:hypothetical protein MRX96_015617 [Rhipicephalus microplus]
MKQQCRVCDSERLSDKWIAGFGRPTSETVGVEGVPRCPLCARGATARSVRGAGDGFAFSVWLMRREQRIDQPGFSAVVASSSDQRRGIAGARRRDAELFHAAAGRFAATTSNRR